MAPLRLAIVGLGKIARDQHLPAIAATAGVELVAVASRNASLDGVAHYATLDDLLAADTAVDAVALCTPPQVRRAQAEAALRAGKHVLLEKPPGATVAEIGPLVDLAEARGVSLFAAWHSRFAPGVEPARTILAGREIRAVRICWKEDVRVWHPGQDWIWQPGGLGVFDPGINALSILTAILPAPVFLTAARLSFPENRAAPIAADLTMTDAAGTTITGELDFRQTGPQTWDIAIETGTGTVTLHDGGHRLADKGETLLEGGEGEYAGIYRRFAGLVQAGASDVDLAPLALVADAFLLGERAIVEPFVEEPA